MKPAVLSKPRPLPTLPPSGSAGTSPPSRVRTSPSTLHMRCESAQSLQSSGSRPTRIVAGGCGGPSTKAGPSGCHATCPASTQRPGPSPQRPPRPEDAEAPRAQLYEAQPAQAVPLSSSSPSSKPLPQRTSSSTTVHRHLSIANSSSVLPFSNKRRPSIPLADFPTSPTDDEWEDFSFEEDLPPVSPTRRTLRRRPSAPLSPRLTKGASLARSHASRRIRKSRFPPSRGPSSPANATFNRPLSLYSTYSFYDPSQIDLLDQVGDYHDPASMPHTDHEDVDEFGDVPGGSNLLPRASVSSIATVRPSPEQRKESRLNGLKDKLRWLPGRSGHAQESSDDEGMSPEAATAVAANPARPAYFRSRSTSAATKQRPVFSKPGFRSLSKSSVSSNDFQPSHSYKSSTDSSSYAPSLSSFEQNVRMGGRSESFSSCGDEWVSEDSPQFKPRPLSPSQASSIIMPEALHTRNRSDNYEHLRPRSAISTQSIRMPTLRMKNGVPHHSADPARVPYPLAYSANMMAADRWNHALLFGDERNPGNAGGLLRGSTVSFSQFYGVGSGKKEVLKGKELRGGKVLDLGCGEGLWVLAAAKEWRHTRFVGFDLLPIQMNLQEKLEGVKNAQDIIDRIEWVQGDFLQKKLPFADNSFDLVRLANTTLALPTDPEEDNYRLRNLFSEIFRILKVDGELEIIDEDHIVPSGSKASPSHPNNQAFPSHVGPQMCQLEKAFENMLQYHNLSAYPVIPNLLEQHFSTATKKDTFRLAVTPDNAAIDDIRRRSGIYEETAVRVEIDRDLGLVEEPPRPNKLTHGRMRSGSNSATRGRNHKMLRLLGEEFAEVRKPVVPQALIVLPNKMLPMSQAAVYAHATHSTNVILAAKEQLFDYVELCAQGRAVADRDEFEDVLWEYETRRFDRLGLRDPLRSFNDWDSGISDANEGLCSGEQRSPKLGSPPADAARVGSMGPLPAWRYESEDEVVTVREIRVYLARKLSLEPPRPTCST